MTPDMLAFLIFVLQPTLTLAVILLLASKAKKDSK